MEYLRRLLIGDIDALVERRKAQIVTQAALDKRLKALPCYHMTALYLLIVREDNRERTLKFNGFSQDAAIQQLDAVDREHERLRASLDDGTFCTKDSPFVNVGFFAGRQPK